MSMDTRKTPEQMVEAVFALDLDPIKFKLMHSKEGPGWSREEVDRQELEYRRFLALAAKFPEEAIVPDTDVDKFWHTHILDTMKYAEDCQNVFGYFLHHFPYFGLRDAQDAANLASAAAKTRALYMLEFGAARRAEAAYCGAVAGKVEAAYCGAVADKTEAAYCGAVASKAEAAYCGATQAAYGAVVAGKGRPVLDQAVA